MTGVDDTQAIAPFAPGGGTHRRRPAPRHPHPRHPAPRRPGLGVRALRGLTGVLAGGLVVLAAALGWAQWMVTSSGRPGPGAAVLAGHIAGALVAVVAQVVADRSWGRRAVLASLTVLLVAGCVLWFGWWA